MWALALRPLCLGFGVCPPGGPRWECPDLQRPLSQLHILLPRPLALNSCLGASPGALPAPRPGSQNSEQAGPGPLVCFCSQAYSTPSPDVQCPGNHYFTRFDYLVLSGREVNPDGPSGPVSAGTKVPSATSDVWVRPLVIEQADLSWSGTARSCAKRSLGGRGQSQPVIPVIKS